MQFTFHVLNNPKQASKVEKFCKLMDSRGHTVYQYDEPYIVNKKEFDFLISFGGDKDKEVCLANPELICVQIGINYPDNYFALYRSFESRAIYNAYYGLNSINQTKQNFYDTVIPDFFNPDDYKFSDKKQDYFLFVGDVQQHKGVVIAIEATQSIGVKLSIAGKGTLADIGYKEVPAHVTEFGVPSQDDKVLLLSNAIGTFITPLYNEPFSDIQVESLLSGTPTITTDWGCLPENNIHGKTGYLCNTFEEFQFTAMDVASGKIKPQDCRDFAMEKFTPEVVGPKYENYFENIMDLYAVNPDSSHIKPAGWYTNHLSRWEKRLENLCINPNPRNEVTIVDF